ncbi:hypothetical protein BDP27DRAFT_1438770 [Rhodocollybia butyracea]|uniref:Uncharacterized protein n=1 Tax=Rhodocollybia butyracea TaxID=206335 RepID=A0A9P5P3B1_9AGAR|nr:hypothetical protein BDP27DRAFT_1438770 [Rhodocollybia butyracea]
MKFIDGFWLLKNGVKPYYGLQAVKVDQLPDGYELQVSTKPIRHRGDTLGGPVLTVKVHSPTEGVPPPPLVRYINSELKYIPRRADLWFWRQFGAFVKNGSKYQIWNQDGGTSSERHTNVFPST